MAYTKQTWADLPSKTTPINANRLTHIEDGIFNAAATADNAASAAGTAVSQIGQVSSRVDTLTGRVNGLDTAVSNKVDKVTGKGLSTNDYDDTDKGKVDSLGTASTKNSTSVVTESSDLVESGAVYDALGFGNKNLFNKNDVENGIINESGAIAIVGEWKSSKFIKVTPSEKYIISGLNISYASSGGFAFYNSAKTFVSGGGINVFKNTPITIPDNVEYIRFSLVPADLDTAQLEKGSTATSYEPYHASVEEYCASKQDVIDTVGWIQRNLVFKTIPNANINADGGIRTSEYSLAVAKVKANEVYTISPISTVFVYGFFTSEPIINSISYNNSRSVVNKDSAQTETFTAPIDGYIAVRFAGSSDMSIVQVEEGSTATPYHASVEESLDEKCDNTVIGTVEGANASKAWSVGEHFIKDGAFKEVTQPIASGGAINDSNTVDRPIAELLTRIMSQLGTLKHKIINIGLSTGMVTTDIYTGNQFFALVIMLEGNNIAFAYCGRRFNAGTFVTSDNTILGVSDNGYLQVLGNADSRRYHILYAQN